MASGGGTWPSTQRMITLTHNDKRGFWKALPGIITAAGLIPVIAALTGRPITAGTLRDFIETKQCVLPGDKHLQDFLQIADRCTAWVAARSNVAASGPAQDGVQDPSGQRGRGDTHGR